jgi:hypothetical protein
MLNPNGWLLHKQIPACYRSPVLSRFGNEFRSPEFHEPATHGFVLIASWLFLIGVWARPRLHAVEVLLIVALGCGSLLAVRNIPIFALVVAPMLAAGMSELWRSILVFRRGSAGCRSASVLLLLACCSCYAGNSIPNLSGVSGPQDGSLPQMADSETVYAPDPRHLWNRLFVAFYERNVRYPVGYRQARSDWVPERIGPNVLDPPLGIHPSFLLETGVFERCNAVCDEFLRMHGEELSTNPLQRAVLQRDLWAVFDVLQTEQEDCLRNYGETPAPLTEEQQMRRAILSRKIGVIIGRLALPMRQIETLPDTYSEAVDSGAFPIHPGGQREADYVPEDLCETNSPWVEVLPARNKLFDHSMIVRGRSVFRVFLRPPSDAGASAAFSAWLQQIEHAERLQAGAAERPDVSPELRSVASQNMPVGTQMALLREMLLVNDQKKIVPSHIVESLQLRCYLGRPSDPAELSQLFEEFVLDRPFLFQNKQGGLRPTAFSTPVFFGYMALGRLAVNQKGEILPLEPFPQSCIRCHVQPQPGGEHLPESYFPNRPPRIASFARPIRFARSDTESAEQQTILWKSSQPEFLELVKYIGAEAGHDK